MNYEKSCYSLLGCLIVGSIIQSNMNLNIGYFIAITIILWILCISMQIIVSKKNQRLDSLIESDRQNVHSKQFEQLISILSQMQEKQTEDLNNLVHEAKTILSNNADNAKKELEEIKNCLVEESYAIHKEITLNTVATEKFSDNYDSNSKESERVLAERIDKFEKSLIAKIETYNFNMNTLRDKIQNYYELLLHQVTDFNDEIKDEHEVLINKIDNININNSQSLDNCTKVICDCLEKAEKSSEESRNVTAKKITDQISIIKNSFEDISVSEKQDREAFKDTISEMSDNLLGSISNIQSSVEILSSSVDEIRNISSDSLENIGDFTASITEYTEECLERINILTDTVEKNSEKQLNIISNEAEILNHYDKLISYINDEIIVKLISDSNNLLNCMKDCYSLLESLRKVRNH